MAHTLNLQVIVEGIETAEQSGFFAGSERRILGQGWFYGRPISAEEFHQRVLDQATVPASINNWRSWQSRIYGQNG